MNPVSALPGGLQWTLHPHRTPPQPREPLFAQGFPGILSFTQTVFMARQTAFDGDCPFSFPASLPPVLPKQAVAVALASP